jgi:hypothetical protein
MLDDLVVGPFPVRGDAELPGGRRLQSEADRRVIDRSVAERL